MKTILVLASLMLAGPAAAQDAMPTGNGPVTTDPSAAPTSQTTPPPAEPMPSPNGMSSTPSLAPASSSPSSANSPAANQPMKEYPTCTRKIRDNCRNPGGR